MDARTLTALKASIRHWQDNVEAEKSLDACISEHDCALCIEFFEDLCEGCPVQERTGRKLCRGTPYVKASMAFRKWCEEENRKQFRAAAIAERDFLISLLPEGEDSGL